MNTDRSLLAAADMLVQSQGKCTRGNQADVVWQVLGRRSCGSRPPRRPHGKPEGVGAKYGNYGC